LSENGIEAVGEKTNLYDSKLEPWDLFYAIQFPAN